MPKQNVLVFLLGSSFEIALFKLQAALAAIQTLLITVNNHPILFTHLLNNSILGHFSRLYLSQLHIIMVCYLSKLYYLVWLLNVAMVVYKKKRLLLLLFNFLFKA